jgi:hypothetical protein
VKRSDELEWEAAYNRAKKRRPTEYTEYAELQETEIAASGSKIRGKHGKGFGGIKGVSEYN